jgi:ribosomal protein L29
MKKKDLKGFTSKSVAELTKFVGDLQKQTLSLSMQLKSRKLKNTNAVKNLKRSIAQAKTLVNNKKLNNES